MVLIYLSCAWVLGIFLGSIFEIPLILMSVGLAPLPLLIFFRQQKKIIVLTSLCLVILFGGAGYYGLSVPPVDDSHLQFYNDHGTVELKGIIERDPDIRDRTSHLRLAAREIRLDEAWHQVSGSVLLIVPHYPAYSYGDVLLVRGKLETPPQLKDFDYKDYLAHQEIYATILYPDIKILETGQGFKPLEWVYSVRNRLSQTLAEVLPEPQASLAQKIILGMRGNIPSSTRDAFINSGTAHLLAISGLHLSIVAGTLLSLGTWLFGRRRHIYIWLALVGVWLYALLTGMQPPVFRAAIMVSLFLTAELLGRQRSAITALAFAAAIMVGLSPQVLWQASFQLSFAAMAGLIFIFPPLQSFSRKAVSTTLGEEGVAVSLANFITDSFCVSLGALLAVWPLVAYYFGVISPIGPLATLFALPALSGIIVTGILAGVIGLIALPVGQVIGWVAWLCLSYVLVVVDIFTAISPIQQGSINVTVIWIYYPILILVIWLGRCRKDLGNFIPKVEHLVSRLRVKWVMPPLLVVAVLVWLTAATMPDDRLHVSFLDVGQGDAILIQQGSQQILIDGGPSAQAIGIALGQKMPFWDRTIDLVVLTQPHADHITGLIEVLNRYQVKKVLYPDLAYDSPRYDEWLNLFKQKNINHDQAQAGQQVKLGELTIDVLNPQVPFLTGTESDIDNNGVVLRLKLGEVSFLLTADIMQEAELELITHRAGLTSTVLKVAHHGSATSTTSEFLAVVQPTLAAISVGTDNSFGHPSDDVMQRLTKIVGQENIYRTDEHGTIEFITDGRRLWVRAER